MNATRHEFCVNIYEDQIEEASLCLLHTIIFHRTTGKYQKEGKGFQIGSVGYKDVNCKTLPLTYVMVRGIFLDSNNILGFRRNRINCMPQFRSRSQFSKNSSKVEQKR